MIAYCNEEGQVLPAYCSAGHYSYNSYYNTWDDDWMRHKISNLEYLRDVVQRELDMYENQMVSQPRSCFVCRSPKNLVAYCYDNYLLDACVYHLQELVTFQQSCNDVIQYFFMDTEYVIGKYWERKIFRQYSFFNGCIHEDMLSFFRAVVRPDRYHNWTHEDYTFTDDFTDPLTTLHGFRYLKYHKPQKRNHFVLHVIHIVLKDMRKLSAWEILLHAFPKETELTIVIIMPTVIASRLEWDCCKLCQDKSKKLVFEFQPMLYHNYASSLQFRPPCAIYGFNARLDTHFEIEETAIAIRDQRCLVILTSMTIEEGETNAKFLQKLPLTRHVSYQIIRNRYASLRPFTRTFTRTAYFANQYMDVIHW